MFENFFKRTEPEKESTQFIEAEPFVIIKPENPELITKLENKLSEYERRVKSFREQLDADPNNKKLENNYNDSLYKFIVLGNLLHSGSVDETKLREAISDQHGGVYSGILTNAMKVIKSYVEGDQVFGGSGLK